VTDVKAPSTQRLLAAWEHDAGGVLDRTARLLASCCDGVTVADLERLCVGEWDAMLLQLRERTFGPHFAGLSTCPSCGVSSELNFDFEDVRFSSAASGEIVESDHAGYRVTARIPVVADLTHAATTGNRDAARRCLLGRIITDVRKGGGMVAVDDLPLEVERHLAGVLAEADPQADVLLELHCDSCGHRWDAIFDIESFLWHEIDAWAARTLRQVHTLARAYGWSEEEILAMSPTRRRRYLEMVER